MILLAAFAGLFACAVPPDPLLEDTIARDAYFKAWCRLYSEPLCVRDELNQCEWDRSFPNRSDCEAWMTFRVSQCPGANAMFVEDEARVHDCVEQLQTFECGHDTFCVDQQPTFNSDACEPITTFLEENCQDEADG
jgi:hypothetical protein